MTAVTGNPVHFIAGKYGGKMGWVNNSENADEENVPVIVNLGRKREKDEAAPNSYAEAVLQQCQA
jgi:hypothetical protein